MTLVGSGFWEFRKLEPKEPVMGLYLVQCTGTHDSWLAMVNCEITVPENLKNKTDLTTGYMEYRKIKKRLSTGSLVEVESDNMEATTVECANEKYFVISTKTCKVTYPTKTKFFTES